MKLIGKAIWKVKPKLEKYENSSQSLRLRSNVTNFESLLVFLMGHILIKLHQFSTSSFRDFLRTTHRQTHRQMPPKTIPARSMRAGNKRQLKDSKYLQTCIYFLAPSGDGTRNLSIICWATNCGKFHKHLSIHADHSFHGFAFCRTTVLEYSAVLSFNLIYYVILHPV